MFQWEIEVEDESGQRALTPECPLWFGSNILWGHKLYANKGAADRTTAFPSTKIAFAPKKGPTKAIGTALSDKLQQLKSRGSSASEIKTTLENALSDTGRRILLKNRKPKNRSTRRSVFNRRYGI